MECCSKKKKLPGYKSTSLYVLSHKFRFTAEELIQQQARFERMAEEGTVSIDAFSSHMGMLGHSSNKFLSNRIFKSMNTSDTGYVTFEEYLEYMDILIHGNEDQKARQSFNLIKKKDSSVISREDFKHWLVEILKFYSSITGLEANSSNEALEQYFEMIDLKKDGVIDFLEYKTTMREKKEIFHWFDYITEGIAKKFDPVKVEEQPDYIKRLESVEDQLRKCIEVLQKSHHVGPKSELLPENLHGGDSPVSCLSSIDIESIISFSNQEGEDSEVLPECLLLSQKLENNPEPNKNILSLLKELENKVNIIRQGLKREKSMNARVNIPKAPINKKSLIQWGDEDWNLILNMMLGIQKSVQVNRDISQNYPQPSEFEFKAMHNLLPSRSSYKREICQFKDYSPSIFLRLRLLSNISNESYLSSLGVMKLMHSLFKGEISSLIGLVSAGKSGCFFYYSDDGQYMLKTMPRKEYLFLKSILPGYYHHLVSNPDTILIRYYGLHKILYKKGKDLVKQYFVVMGNVFKSPLEVHMRYDLKGSTYGRTTDENEDFSIPRKDIDFNRAGIKIKLGEEMKGKVMEIIQNDVGFLRDNEINDYSLLLGIHNIKGECEVVVDTNLTLTQRVFGGMLAEDKKCVYFLGIIDLLTVFNFTKRLEHLVKSQLYGNTVSCVPPTNYSERFLRYIESIII